MLRLLVIFVVSTEYNICISLWQLDRCSWEFLKINVQINTCFDILCSSRARPWWREHLNSSSKTRMPQRRVALCQASLESAPRRFKTCLILTNLAFSRSYLIFTVRSRLCRCLYIMVNYRSCSSCSCISPLRYFILSYTVKPVIKTTWEIGTPWELRTAASVRSRIQSVEMDLRNKTTSEFSTLFLNPLGVPNSQVSLSLIHVCTEKTYFHP